MDEKIKQRKIDLTGISHPGKAGVSYMWGQVLVSTRRNRNCYVQGGLEFVKKVEDCGDAALVAFRN
jgi:hypothetical protein